MVAHGFLAALTFALSGYVYEQTGTLEIDKMGGLLKRLPFIGTTMIIAMLAGCGLPGFANFWGESMVLFGSWNHFTLITLLAVWGALVIGGVYMLRGIRNIWHGDKVQPETIKDTPCIFCKLPYVLLLAGLITFGCFPKLLTDNIKTSVAPIVAAAENKPPVLLDTPIR
jgi:NADH-quinone oxidoreductase subunit M